MTLRPTSPAMAVLFLLSGVAAGTRFLRSVGENGGTEFVPHTDVTVSLSTTKTVFAADELVLIKVTLKNNMPDRPAQILDWVLPCNAFDSEGEEMAANEGAAPPEMSHFDIQTRGDRVVAYEGVVVKRRTPVEEDYRTLAVGEEYACTVDLGNYYDFEGMDGDDDYEISFVVVSDQLSGPSDGEEILRSKSVELTIDGRASPSSRRPAVDVAATEAAGSTTFRQCSTSEQNDATVSRRLAVDAAAEVVDLLAAVGAARSSSSCPRYEEWFSSYNSLRHQGLETDHTKIHDRLVDASIRFDCTCNTRGTYAYVYPSRPYDIYLCPEFWRTGMTGTDSKVGTVIHEISHFTVVAGTDDHAYGQRLCRDLAKNNVNKALKNADNLGYAAENNPALKCNTAPPGPTDPPSRAPTCPIQTLEVNVVTDSYPDETSYTIKNKCTNVVEYTKINFDPSTSNKDTYCLSDAKYEFTIEDKVGDGICCSYGEGSYTVTYKENEIKSGGEFVTEETTSFGGTCGDDNFVLRIKKN